MDTLMKYVERDVVEDRRVRAKAGGAPPAVLSLQTPRDRSLRREANVSTYFIKVSILRLII